MVDLTTQQERRDLILSEEYHRSKRNLLLIVAIASVFWCAKPELFKVPGIETGTGLRSYTASVLLLLALIYFFTAWLLQYKSAFKIHTKALNRKEGEIAEGAASRLAAKCEELISLTENKIAIASGYHGRVQAVRLSLNVFVETGLHDVMRSALLETRNRFFTTQPHPRGSHPRNRIEEPLEPYESIVDREVSLVRNALSSLPEKIIAAQDSVLQGPSGLWPASTVAQAVDGLRAELLKFNRNVKKLDKAIFREQRASFWVLDGWVCRAVSFVAVAMLVDGITGFPAHEYLERYIPISAVAPSARHLRTPITAATPRTTTPS